MIQDRVLVAISVNEKHRITYLWIHIHVLLNHMRGLKTLQICLNSVFKEMGIKPELRFVRLVLKYVLVQSLKFMDVSSSYCPHFEIMFDGLDYVSKVWTIRRSTKLLAWSDGCIRWSVTLMGEHHVRE